MAPEHLAVDEDRRCAEDAARDGLLHLHAQLPAQDWRAARAVATHPRIAQAATDTGFGVVCLSRPALPEVVASIESIR